MGNANMSQTSHSNKKKDETMYRRRAHHAGSWYEDDEATLRVTLDRFLEQAAVDTEKQTTAPEQHQQEQQDDSENEVLCGVIVPHAGYSYSGFTAAYSYGRLQQALTQRLQLIQQQQQQQQQSCITILVLHPSHHVYLEGGCAVSGANVIETPVGNLEVDDELRQTILNMKSTTFTIMSQSTDEHEHSGEMQYPYLAHIIQSARTNAAAAAQGAALTFPTRIQVLPIMCGSLSVHDEIRYGQALMDIIAPPNTEPHKTVLTVVSTDFCHWGSRFRYQPTDNNNNSIMPIHLFIQQLDRQGMEQIELQRPGAFADYLRTTKNTICGRHAIAVWLRALQAAAVAVATVTHNNNNDTTAVHADTTKSNNNPRFRPVRIQFIHYAQSSPAKTLRDSSVSYAAAVATAMTTQV